MGQFERLIHRCLWSSRITGTNFPVGSETNIKASGKWRNACPTIKASERGFPGPLNDRVPPTGPKPFTGGPKIEKPEGRVCIVSICRYYVTYVLLHATTVNKRACWIQGRHWARFVVSGPAQLRSMFVSREFCVFVMNLLWTYIRF